MASYNVIYENNALQKKFAKLPMVENSTTDQNGIWTIVRSASVQRDAFYPPWKIVNSSRALTLQKVSKLRRWYLFILYLQLCWRTFFG